MARATWTMLVTLATTYLGMTMELSCVSTLQRLGISTGTQIITRNLTPSTRLSMITWWALTTQPKEGQIPGKRS